MLILIDQSNANALRYRCDLCLTEVPSNIPRASDGQYLDTASNPQRWVAHECPTEPKKAKK